MNKMSNGADKTPTGVAWKVVGTASAYDRSVNAVNIYASHTQFDMYSITERKNRRWRFLALALSWTVFFFLWRQRVGDKLQKMRQRGSGSYHMKASLCCVIDFHLSLRLFCFTANPSSVFDPKTSAVPVCQSPFSSSSLLHSVSLSFYPHYKQRPNFSWAQDRVGSCYFRGGKDGKLCVTRYAWNRICMTCPPATLLFQVADLDKMIGSTAGNVPFRDVNILSAFVARPDHVVAVKNKRKKKVRD